MDESSRRDRLRLSRVRLGAGGEDVRSDIGDEGGMDALSLRVLEMYVRFMEDISCAFTSYMAEEVEVRDGRSDGRRRPHALIHNA